MKNLIRTKKVRVLAALTALLLVFEVVGTALDWDLFSEQELVAEAATTSMTTTLVKSMGQTAIKERGVTVSSDTYTAGDDYNWYTWDDVSDEDKYVYYVDAEKLIDAGYEITAVAGAVGYKISYTNELSDDDITACTTQSTDEIADTMYEGDDNSYDVTAVGATTPTTGASEDNLYYTVSYDESLGTNYRTYYISTAAQLAKLLARYKANYSVSNDATKMTSSALFEADSSTAFSKYKLRICLLCDLNLGGAGTSHSLWGFTQGLYSAMLQLDGNNHTLYNGNFNKSKTGSACCLLPDRNRVIVQDLDICNSFMSLTASTGLLGSNSRFCYFNNVNFNECVLATSSSAACFLLGNSYYSVYVRDCSVSDSIVLANQHTACFASWTNTNMNYDYTSDSTDNVVKSTEIPETLSEIEGYMSNSTIYLAIFEDSYVVDSYVYDYGGTHSGTFISCTQGGLVCRRCFTNSTLYGSDRLGVFIGAVIGSGGQGFIMEVEENGVGDLVDTRVNAYFEDCYTSGTVEGSSRLGGFVGMIFDDYRCYNNNRMGVAVFKDCYSTSSVGMQYSGYDIGGFVGVIRGNVGTAMSSSFAYSNDSGSSYSTASSANTGCNDIILSNTLSTDITNYNAQNHLFINCYVAGEVGGITTSTTGGEDSSIGAFIGEYRIDHAILYDSSFRLVNCYYDMQTTGMREKDIGDPGTTSDTLNYYIYSHKITASLAMTNFSVDDDGYFLYKDAATYTNTDKTTQLTDDNIPYIAVAKKLINSGYCIDSSIDFSYDTITNALYPATFCDSTSNSTLNISKSSLEEQSCAYRYVVSNVSTAYTGTCAGSGNNFTYDDDWDLTGVYTTPSTDKYKEIEGLTYDSTKNYSVSMADSSWRYVDEYYPQLAVFFDSNLNNFSEDKQELVFNYAMASTAAVLLDHYDTVLTMNGYTKEYCYLNNTELANLGGLSEQRLVYDTVRDITRKFEFTSTDSNGNMPSVSLSSTNSTESGGNISWTTDSSLNSEFYSYIDTTENGSGVSLEYYNTDYTVSYNPSVLTIAVDITTEIGRYKCYDFSCGKQWVTISYDQNNSLTQANYTDGTLSSIEAVDTEYDTTGVRNLRLLPSAYINAGETITVEVSNDQTAGTTNTVTIGDSTSNTTTLNSFDHSVGVAYAISDKTRMGDASNQYTNHVLTEYYDNNAASNTSSFAFYGRYNLTSSNNSNTTVAEWVDEKFTNNSVDNLSTQTSITDGSWSSTTAVGGQTIVRVYNTVIDNSNPDVFTLEMGDEITNADELLKWSGEETFTNTDRGYYYMVYYWQLDDSRYLTDTKLVQIKSSVNTVTLITGILGTQRVENDVNQYVVADTTSNPTYLDGSNTTLYDYYNRAIEYDNETYYCNSNTLDQSNNNKQSQVGWYTDNTNLLLKTIIIEVTNTEGVQQYYQEIEVDNLVTTHDFTYDYDRREYTITQNTETKTFTISTITTATEQQTLTASVSSSNINDLIKDIVFNFTKTGVDPDCITVTALFVPGEADVQTSKDVLYGVTNTAEITDINGLGGESLAEYEEARSVDNTNATTSLAVLSGDTLTYRIAVDNLDGTVAAYNVQVADTIPDGCTFVTGSIKVYEQMYNSGTSSYGAVGDVTDDISIYGPDRSNKITWSFSSIEEGEIFYIEYQVTVDQIAASTLSDTLTNTATVTLNDGTELTTNEVQTDVTHLYFSVEKKIENDDSEQTFLFEVKYYADGDTSGTADSITYVVLNCTDKSASKILQTDKRGTYVITEITDWSYTDYEDVSSSVTVPSNYSSYYSGSASGDSVTLVIVGDGGAFPTALGSLEDGTYMTASFENTESIYAYRSGQAYSYNTFIAS
ncbi:MAG: hypothetical protein LUC25_07445 [Ruminococcus sp.]|nr:hypothetical protein [Ruminococcus sp.]